MTGRMYQQRRIGPIPGSRKHSRPCCEARAAFTLVELLVVISIIALLISILLPSLRNAREQAKAVKCGANLKQVGTAIATYLVESNAVYPPSYVYPTDNNGSWGIKDGEQSNDPVPHGYLHWSYFLYSGGKADEEAFQCPSFAGGGAPRTNPGPTAQNWEGGQVDAAGQTLPNALVDKQAIRIAYTANSAIMPRNKFTPVLSGGLRTNQLVQEGRIKRPGDTVMAVEFLSRWQALGDSAASAGGVLVKSHRPITPFCDAISIYDEYGAPPNSPGFLYGTKLKPKSMTDYGLVPLKDTKNLKNVLKDKAAVSQINAVGRHHPGGDKTFGGTANFLFVDSHVERTTALSTVEYRRWGDTFHSMSGNNKVVNAYPQ